MAPLAALLRKHIGWSVAGLALVALLLSGPAPAHAQYDPFHTPVIDSILAAEDSIAAASAPPSDSTADKHALLRGLDALDGFLPFWLFEALLFLSLVVIPLVCAGGFAAVALFMDAGCLRIALAVLGWGSALLGGLLAGGLLGTMLGALSFFGWAGVITCGIGYPILYARTRRRVEQLPRTEYLTWKHTLTGAALLGTGASSAASLGRSAGALFKGSGGSFGGGGASGAFGGGQIAQVTAASAQSAGGSSAVVFTSEAAPVAAGAVAAVADTDNPSTPLGYRVKRVGNAVLSFARRLRWYHGVAFVLILLVFLPVGMGVGAIFQRPRLLLWIVGVYALFRMPSLLVRSGIEAAASLYIFGLFFALVGAGMAAESQAPYWHLAIASVIAVVIEIGHLVLPNNLPEEGPQTDRETPFQGGGASARW